MSSNLNHIVFRTEEQLCLKTVFFCCAQVAKNAPLLLIGAASTDAEASQQQLVAYTGDSQDAQASSLDAPAETVLLSPAQVCPTFSFLNMRHILACSNFALALQPEESAL